MFAIFSLLLRSVYTIQMMEQLMHREKSRGRFLQELRECIVFPKLR